jgi:hypothetical protein
MLKLRFCVQFLKGIDVISNMCASKDVHSFPNGLHVKKWHALEQQLGFGTVSDQSVPPLQYLCVCV